MSLSPKTQNKLLWFGCLAVRKDVEALAMFFQVALQLQSIGIRRWDQFSHLVLRDLQPIKHTKSMVEALQGLVLLIKLKAQFNNLSKSLQARMFDFKTE